MFLRKRSGQFSIAVLATLGLVLLLSAFVAYQFVGKGKTQAEAANQFENKLNSAYNELNLNP